MIAMRNQMVSVLLVLAVTLIEGIVFTACEDEEEYRDFNTPVSSGPGGAARVAHKRTKTGTTGMVEAMKVQEGVVLPQLTETSFIDGPTRRDPFVPFVEVLQKQERVLQTVQREVKLKEYDIAELKLIGIITNIGDPRAMVVTPDSTGYVIKRGDYVGRADYITQGSQEDVIQVNWRVARIHGTGKEEERGIYLIRDDPTTSRGVDVTKFIPLHPVE